MQCRFGPKMALFKSMKFTTRLLLSPQRGCGLIAWSSLCILIALNSRSHAASEDQDILALEAKLAAMGPGPAPEVADAVGVKLAAALAKLPLNAVTDQEFANLVMLLKHPSDSVRLWAGKSLGELGARAQVAVPDLETARRKVACLRLGLGVYGPSSEDAISDAILKITSKQPKA